MGDTASIPGLGPLATPSVALSVVIVSFNTRETLRECLALLRAELDRAAQHGCTAETLVVDNASTDGSAEMVEQMFPEVRLLRSEVNLGFGAANNRALLCSRGESVLLLNSDALLEEPVLVELLGVMAADARVGMAGVAQVGRDGAQQPSARRFHTLWRDGCVMTGLAERWPQSALWGRMFGGLDRRWAGAAHPVDVDWIPGALMLIRRSVLEQIGLFDERFFLYVEEVDLCRRAVARGWRVVYCPEFSVVHLGGESASSVNAAGDSAPSHQVVLWRMRSTLLYYRKWFGWQAWAAAAMELALYRLRWLRNRWSGDGRRRMRARHALQLLARMQEAWRDTDGGRVSPPRPW